MALPVALKNKIVDFLTSLPNINDSNDQQAFIHHATLDDQLQRQIKFPGAVAQFVDLLIPTLVQYGQLEDDRNPLEIVLHAVLNGEKQPSRSPFPLSVQFSLKGGIQDLNKTIRLDKNLVLGKYYSVRCSMRILLIKAILANLANKFEGELLLFRFLVL